ncbi:MAG: cellobiose phosphorylase, partial [Patescibacteria group bacterium]|nr:cellobiose phosphorylase [Patescibacteria group bacterium]
MPSDFYTYSPDGITFTSRQAAAIKTIYAPLCGVDAASLKSSISPSLGGDIKVDKLHYLTRPASREDLRRALREFFVRIKGGAVCGLSQGDPADAHVEIGPLWHKAVRVCRQAGVALSAVNFIPVSSEHVELMQVSVKNISSSPLTLTPTAALPLFGRCLANKHDHEHVTSLLNRTSQVPEGVLLKATMVFNEEGHKTSSGIYFVFGAHRNKGPRGSFPTVDSFYGDGGCLEAPAAVLDHREPVALSARELNGKEAVGALRFDDVTLAPGEEEHFVLAAGMAAGQEEARRIWGKFNTPEKFAGSWKENRAWWLDKISAISFQTGDASFNSWMRWVTLQPVLRRIFGCSFLPDHDYGKGGRGWRDIWQDLLSLILIEPADVRQDLINNCAGIRIDGSNATIIGTKPGEFIADRNAITRVWMDHGAWPWLTLLLYIDQTGDFEVLLSKQSYFRDPQLSRTHDKDIAWVSQYGNRLLDKKGQVYEGTILEHMLVAHLTQFFNVGVHNIIRLESADWNDGLDMAAANGESVAFSALYAGNLLSMADLLEDMAKAGAVTKLRLLREVLILLDSLNDKEKINYDDAQVKRRHLFGKYFHSVQPAVSGETVEVSVKDLVRDLRAKGHWLFAHIQRQEKIQVNEGGSFTWFNGYYDNQEKRVEGLVDGRVRMTLTGQVFAIMTGLASQDDIKRTIASVDHFL